MAKGPFNSASFPAVYFEARCILWLSEHFTLFASTVLDCRLMVSCFPFVFKYARHNVSERWLLLKLS
jgi:hypothetical protein